MRGYIILYCFLCILTFSCDEEDESTLLETDIGIITGLYLTNEVGSPVGQVGNPNEKSSDLNAFPIPALFNVNVDANINIERLWILPGDVVKEFNQINYSDLLADYQYLQSDITANSIQETLVNKSIHNIDFTNIGPGYYRIFVQLEDGTFDWKNICILDADNNQAYDDFLDEWGL